MILALIAYGAIVLWVGVLAAARSAQTKETFLVADRSFGLLATWAALSSTTIGGSTTLVLASLVASKGLPGLWLDLAGAAGLILLGARLASRVRETGACTISEVLGHLYGREVRRVAAVLVISAEVVWFALLTQATETVVIAATAWNPQIVLVSTAALFVAYTAIGGQRAVVGTDVFQFSLMILGVFSLALPAALSSLRETGLPHELLHFPTGPGFGFPDILAMLVLVGLPHAVGGDVWAKVLSARDGRIARRAAYGAAVSKLAFGAAVVVIAMSGVAAGFLGTGAAASLFPRTVLGLVGPGLAPILFVAMIATMQSSSDSVLLSAAGATSHDLGFSPFGRHGSRILVVFFGVIGLVIALVKRDLVDTFRLGYTLFASSLIVPTLVALLRGKSSRFLIAPRSAATAMILGGVVALVMRSFPELGLDPVLCGTAVNALTLLAGVRRNGRLLEA